MLFRFEAMTKNYYRQARAALLCYDVTDTESFEKVKFWVQELRQYEPKCALYLVGTKLDLIESSTTPSSPSAANFGSSTQDRTVQSTQQPLGSYQTRRGPMRTRQISVRQAQDYLADVDGVAAFEISSKTGNKVDDVFLAVAQHWIDHQKSFDDPALNPSASSGTEIDHFG